MLHKCYVVFLDLYYYCNYSVCIVYLVSISILSVLLLCIVFIISIRLILLLKILRSLRQDLNWSNEGPDHSVDLVSDYMLYNTYSLHVLLSSLDFDVPGTIIASASVTSQTSLLAAAAQTFPTNNKLFHLVRNIFQSLLSKYLLYSLFITYRLNQI